MRNFIVSAIALLVLIAVIGYAVSYFKSDISSIKKEIAQLRQEWNESGKHSNKPGTAQEPAALVTTELNLIKKRLTQLEEKFPKLGGTTHSFAQLNESVKKQIADLRAEMRMLSTRPTQTGEKPETLDVHIGKGLFQDIASLREDIRKLKAAQSADGQNPENQPEVSLSTLKREVERLKLQITKLQKSGNVPAISNPAEDEAIKRLTDAKRKRCKFVQDYLEKLENVYAIREPEERTSKRFKLDDEYKETRVFVTEKIGTQWLTSYEDALQAVYFVAPSTKQTVGSERLSPIRQAITQKCFKWAED